GAPAPCAPPDTAAHRVVPGVATGSATARGWTRATGRPCAREGPCTPPSRRHWLCTQGARAGGSPSPGPIRHPAGATLLAACHRSAGLRPSADTSAEDAAPPTVSSPGEWAHGASAAVV